MALGDIDARGRDDGPLLVGLVGAHRFTRYRARVSDRTQASPLELEVTTSLGFGTVARPIQEFLDTPLMRAGGSVD